MQIRGYIAFCGYAIVQFVLVTHSDIESAGQLFTVQAVSYKLNSVRLAHFIGDRQMLMIMCHCKTLTIPTHQLYSLKMANIKRKFIKIYMFCTTAVSS